MIKPRQSLMQPQALAARLLPSTVFEKLRSWAAHGVPVRCGPDWKADAIEAALRLGCHKSATSPEAIALLKDDLGYQVAAGFSQLLPARVVLEQRPKNFKLSQLMIIPEANR